MSEAFDCVVAGAGVIGLAVGRRLAQAGMNVAVLEAESSIGEHTSSRNSEVIHAGLYYPENSLKARLCVAGKWALYEYCERRGLPYKRLGKVIVATSPEEESKLESIARSAGRNGVDDLERLSSRELADREPAVRAHSALFSPSTGIIDSHEYLLSLQAEVEQSGSVVVTRSRVLAVMSVEKGYDIRISGTAEDVRTTRFVNAAGLWAPELARSCGIAESHTPIHRFARGHYFSYPGRSPFRHLVYPVPIDGGLGIHATNDMAGFVRFGPDAEWIEDIDYGFSEDRKPEFLDAIRRYFPQLDAEKLHPSYTGIRPKLYASGQPSADFRIDGPVDHGLPGLVNLYGIESPGLTASLAIGDYVASLLDA